MQLDTGTVMFISGMIVILCGVVFILNTSFNRNDPPGRLWSITFISAMTVVIGYGVQLADADAWWALTIGNVALTIAVGALWSGTRVYNRRSSLFWVVGAIAVIVCGYTIIDWAASREWAGASVLWAAVTVLAALGGVEALRGRLRRDLNGRILGIVLWVNAVFMGIRTVVFLVDGPEGSLFTTYFNSTYSALFTMVLIVTASIAVSILRAERMRSNAVGDYTVGLYSGAGVLSASGFAQAAADHVQRADHRNVGLALIGADIDKLPELNTAFGRSAGDQAISVFAQTLRGAVPVMAVVGHPAAGRFLVLSAVSSSAEAMELVERIQLTLVDEPLAESQRIRLTASFGLADTFGHGYDLDALMAAVNEAVDEVKGTGGNDIAVAAIAAG